jgi:hypothetical protein
LCVPDIVDHRLGVAREMGADCIYLSKVGEDEQKTVKTVHSLLDRPPDVTIECSGADANIRLAILVRMTRFMFVVTCTSLLICLIYDYHSPPLLIAGMYFAGNLGCTSILLHYLSKVCTSHQMLHRNLPETKYFGLANVQDNQTDHETT